MSAATVQEVLVASEKSTTRERVATYVVVKPLLKTLFDEMKDLAKKKPDAPLSKTKIKIVNRLLEQCQVVLAAEPELKFLDLLDAEGAIAQASDAVLMIGQFVSAMRTFSSRYKYADHIGDHRWTDPRWHVENGEHLDDDGTELDGDDDDADDDEDE
jgi:hypothetical protein